MRHIFMKREIKFCWGQHFHTSGCWLRKILLPLKRFSKITIIKIKFALEVVQKLKQIKLNKLKLITQFFFNFLKNLSCIWYESIIVSWYSNYNKQRTMPGGQKQKEWKWNFVKSVILKFLIKTTQSIVRDCMTRISTY